jgi:hypothetical protein
MKIKLSAVAMFSILLVFGMAVISCDNGTTSNNGGGGGNPLLGAWYHGGTANEPENLLIFSGTSGPALHIASV